MSVRVIFGMFLFFANVVLLVSILVTDILSINNAPHVRSLLFLLVACWIASNWLALKISTDMRSMLTFMPSSDNISETGRVLPEAIGSAIGGKTLMAEVDGMIGRYNILVKNANELVTNLDKRNEAIVNQAQQVAHDIRSPLAAFNVVLPDLDVLPEDTRVMLRNAIFRIQDIAGTLLQSGENGHSAKDQQDSADVIMLSSLVDSVISEKRVQYRDRLYVRIEGASMANSHALFCRVSSRELKRIVSNLINNSVEALSPQGRITVSIHGDHERVRIEVQDDGPGIPDELLSTLGQRGATMGKADGHGLGLYHAFSTLSAMGGSLHFRKPSNGGTIATIILPRVLAPDWFLTTIELSDVSQIVIVDDDLSIHGVWDERFSKSGFESLPRVHLSSADDFICWRNQNEGQALSTYVLMDYELVGSNKNGLQLIQESRSFVKCALVTSRAEEPAVISQARKSNVCMLPKAAAAYVPILIAKSSVSGNGLNCPGR